MGFTAAVGTLLKIETAPGSGTYTTVTQCGDYTGPGMKGEKIDTTTHDAANNGYRTFITGLKEGGTVKFPIFLDPSLSVHQRIIANFEAGIPENWKLAPPFPFDWSFAGVVMELGNKYQLKEAVMMEITIEVSGKPVLAATV